MEYLLLSPAMLKSYIWVSKVGLGTYGSLFTGCGTGDQGVLLVQPKLVISDSDILSQARIL
jgi:hypothetical protein